MNKGPRHPNQPPQRPNVNVQLKDLADIKCDGCNDLRFESVMLLKKVSHLVSPTGKDEILPIPVFSCYVCGHINELFLPPDMRAENKKAEEQKKEDGIISSSPLILEK